MSVFEMESREAFIAEVFPNGRPTTMGSRDYLKENALDWSASRKRLLEAGIRNGDEEQVKMILNEYAYVVGIDGAITTYLTIWGNMVAPLEEIDEDITDEQ